MDLPSQSTILTYFESWLLKNLNAIVQKSTFIKLFSSAEPAICPSWSIFHGYNHKMIIYFPKCFLFIRFHRWAMWMVHFMLVYSEYTEITKLRVFVFGYWVWITDAFRFTQKLSSCAGFDVFGTTTKSSILSRVSQFSFCFFFCSINNNEITSLVPHLNKDQQQSILKHFFPSLGFVKRK